MQLTVIFMWHDGLKLHWWHRLACVRSVVMHGRSMAMGVDKIFWHVAAWVVMTVLIHCGCAEPEGNVIGCRTEVHLSYSLDSQAMQRGMIDEIAYLEYLGC